MLLAILYHPAKEQFRDSMKMSALKEVRGNPNLYLQKLNEIRRSEKDNSNQY